MTASELVTLIQELLLHPMIVSREDICTHLHHFLDLLRKNSQYPRAVDFIRRRIRNMRMSLVLRNVDEREEVRQEPAVVERHVCPCCRAIFRNDVLLAAHSLYHTQVEESYVVGANHLVRLGVTAINGLVRDYKMWSDDDVYNIPSWLHDQSGMMNACLSSLMNVFVVKAMFYVNVKFVRVDPQTGDVVARRDGYIPSTEVFECGQRHFCGIPKVTRLYNHTRKVLQRKFLSVA